MLNIYKHDIWIHLVVTPMVPPWLMTQVLPGQLVSAEPELRLVELDPSLDRFVVLACDGIWDVLQAEMGGCQAWGDLQPIYLDL